MTAKKLCLIVDGHPVLREGITSLLTPEYESEGVCDGREALELLTSVGNFDVAIVEMRGAGGDGVPSGTGAVRDLLAAQPAMGIVALGVPTARHAARAALDAGATAYVSRTSAGSTLREAVDAAAEQEAYVDPSVTRTSGGALTRRQREVFQLFADGVSTEQAAQRLGLSHETVRTHAKSGIARLGARDRSHAVAIALRGSLIE